MSERRNWFALSRTFAWLSLATGSAALVSLVLSKLADMTRTFGSSGSHRISNDQILDTLGSGAGDLPALALVVSACAFFVSAIGTASAVILGWRNERRQAAEFRLKIEQLELQLAEARRSAAAGEKSG